MTDELELMRAELVRLQQDRDRLESELNLWRTRYFELVAQSLGTRDHSSPQDTGSAQSQLSAVGSNPSRFIARVRVPIIA